VVIPDQAKSAATLLAMGAHHILMGPASDLGPVDPQFQLPNGSLAAAKDIIAAVDDATAKVEQAPDTYPLHASLLADITALMVHQARSALARTDALVEEALASCTGRSTNDVAKLKAALHEPLIELPASHAAVFGTDQAATAGLPVQKADPAGEQWRMLWQLWTKYFDMGLPKIYEGRRASHVMEWPRFEDAS
jgi:membrane-bound ClpP family serine protease